MKEYVNLEAAVFAEMCLYAREISGFAGKDIECMGYLYSEKGSGRITGFFFPEQYGSISRASASEFPCMDLYKAGAHLVGMWHSHGVHGLFHSHTDHEHIKSKLAAMKKHNEKAGRWDFNAGGPCLDLFNAQTMQGRRIMLEAGTEYCIKSVEEVLPSSFLSIVINAGAYTKGNGKYLAELFSIKGGELKHTKAGLGLAACSMPNVCLPQEHLAEIGEKYSFSLDNQREHAARLKDTELFKRKLQFAQPLAMAERERPAFEAIARDNSVELKSSHGIFRINLGDRESALRFASRIKSVESISQEETARHIPACSRLPAKKRLEGILNPGEKQEAIVSQAPYKSNNEYFNGARELHLLYVQLFLGSVDFYRHGHRNHMDADKAVVDMFAALSGVFDGNAADYEKRLDKVEECIARLEESGVLEQIHKDAVNEALGIISTGEYAGRCIGKSKQLAENMKTLNPGDGHACS
ncbi:MAG TPA: hypothetical protein HA362_02295 [Nanoarchaeota archaeon]|nr:hypothetical protein [Nanoarchaeota archaeon]